MVLLLKFLGQDFGDGSSAARNATCSARRRQDGQAKPPVLEVPLFGENSSPFGFELVMLREEALAEDSAAGKVSYFYQKILVEAQPQAVVRTNRYWQCVTGPTRPLQ